jgi:hypothetical protein
LEHRGELVWAACVLVRAWLVRGRPSPRPEVPEFGSFEAWRDVVGGILAVHDVQGFLGNLVELETESPDAAALLNLAELIRADKGRGDGPFTVAEIRYLVEDLPDIAAAVDPSGRIGDRNFATRLGLYVREHANQRIGPYRLEHVPGRGHTGGARYRFVLVAGA